MTTDRETLAELLAGHQRLFPGWFERVWCARCGCGELIKCEDGDDRRGWSTHVASVLLASDWLADMKAEVWEEGFADSLAGDTCRCHGNPYRKEARDDH